MINQYKLFVIIIVFIIYVSINNNLLLISYIHVLYVSNTTALLPSHYTMISLYQLFFHTQLTYLLQYK